VKNLINTLLRFVNGLARPSKKTNRRRLLDRGETMDSFTIREAMAVDIPKLAALHVKTWNETYLHVKRPPTFEIRKYQWKQQFTDTGTNWFCLVVENSKAELIGFAKGHRYSSPDLPGYEGELNKIYLLRGYQRLGLGTRMLCYVARRFLSQGITSMVLFGSPKNPSCRFHEAMGAKRLYSKKGEFHGGYGWQDLRPLARVCT